jgi:metal-sulfur cluster biosynthetic enzyme
VKTTNPDEIRDNLRAVIDPEIGINIVDLGLIYGIEVVPYVADEGEPAAGDGDQRAMITMTLTTPGCPVGPHILQEVKSETEAMEQICKAEIDLTFSPMWSEDMISEDVRWILGR